MTNEIKEIIEYLKDENIYIEEHDYCYKRISLKECSEISTYINNLQYRIDKANQLIEKQKKKMYKSRNKIAMYILMNLENILRGDE